MNNRIFWINQKELILKKPGRSDYEVVPPDEPIFILRARDCGALAIIRVNQSRFSPTSKEWKIHQDVIDDFTKFKEESPEKMGEPSECY